MSEHTLPQTPSLPSGNTKLAISFLVWSALLLLLCTAWWILLARVVPARLNFASLDAMLLASTPPVLLTFSGWIVTRRVSQAPKVLAAPVPEETSMVQGDVPNVPANLRVGAWSVLTPHGASGPTIEGTKSRATKFKPDKTILFQSGAPAHASMVEALDLAIVGHPESCRRRGIRVVGMLVAILNNLHELQLPPLEIGGAPLLVLWLVPPALSSGDDDCCSIFASAWQHSAWRDYAYQLQPIFADNEDMFDTLAKLQSDSSHGATPYTLVIAADSLLDPDELAIPLALGQVFSHATPQGFVPSEGAAGLLLLRPDTSVNVLWDNAPSMGPLSRMSAGESELCSLFSEALTASGATMADIGWLVSNCDHRTQARLEVMAAMATILPKVDPMEQRISPMEYTGSFGAASDLIHLALAAELAVESAVLVLVGHNAGRVALVIHPT